MRQLTQAGQKVFEARYAGKDENGHINETFAEAVLRLARAAASAEKENLKTWEEKFSHIIGELLFVPSTPIWANVGKKDRPWQPGACFVLAVEDTLESMYDTLKDMALVFKSGGGVGFNFSAIRPRGDLVGTTKGQASGVVELIRLYDASADMVKQGGVRRGAIMGILNVDHPEIIDFIQAKNDGGLTNFNLSVGVTDAFMEALEKDLPWQLVFNGTVRRELPARRLWRIIIESAHSCGDPGVIFLDRLQSGNPVPENRINATNPCGEQPLSPGESCLLGSINLDRMSTFEGGLNKEILEETVTAAVRFLDNLIDVADYPLPAIAAATRATRKIGLGFTGLADALIKAGLAYDSAGGRELAGTITGLIRQAAHAASEKLAEEKGCFPLWDKSVFYPDRPRRNAACITIAPTGSVTTMAGCEGYGVEPIFAVAYTKTTNVAGDLEVFSPLFLEYIKDYNIPAETLAVIAEKGSCQGIEGIPEEVAGIFKGAREIAPIDHLLMQAAVQKHVDNAVSKTINLPEDASAEDIGACYKTAYELGLKGVTVFREGSKKGTVTVGRERAAGKVPELRRGEILPRPVSAHGMTHRLDTGCGKIYLTINYQPDNGEILETFITTGSDGGCLVYTEAASRLISLAIRGGISVESITEQLEGTHSCPSYMLARGKGKKVSPGKSCASAIAKQLNQVKAELDQRCGKGCPDKMSIEKWKICEACGEAALERAEGCLVCRNCGAARC
ncbi:adenosylcobalamin-dependent ribonucleoside-diphosphate reductase [Pelotomaculum propionicicum]|mgnify:CR=1 FL=1|uniref:Vitamin B12-dependent ribonucleotide reductase n=1 Tax=Pelotomaculum propionicicum TaxID=258475 RepID=A0A4Y7RNX1_9FIRM|nr:adenosylcobalamin-dependent ribonucleoside-diphosphate reductase [Pelotomaculum propionicicum]NLI13753.1 adenosylcobalamin-dependent ribonucleoside-diphosphate reductase [Peptococcaceae bacterium]TEB10496.1 Vitamin B12-dependent ribonucleoside-diphosphate reductase [Pelotomaculum propionicicum]